MELKHYPAYAASVWGKILIAPIWNWNDYDKKSRQLQSNFNRTNMELKHIFNTVLKIAKKHFNRTNMELKLFFFRRWSFFAWNFNRTNMELKPRIAFSDKIFNKNFNRTNMELKLSNNFSKIFSGY